MRNMQELVRQVVNDPRANAIDITEEEACFFLGMTPDQLWAALYKCNRVIEFCGKRANLVWWELEAA